MRKEYLMYPFNDQTTFAYRVERLRSESTQRRMARSARAGAMVRNGNSFRGALGNGLIALGERLTEPPSVDLESVDKAA